MKMRVLKKTPMRVVMKIRIILHPSLILSFFFSFYFWNSYVSTFLLHCVFIQAYQHRNLVIMYTKSIFFSPVENNYLQKNNWIEFPKSQHIQTSPFTSSTKAVVNIYPHKRAQRHLQVFYSSTVIFSFGSF